MRMGDVIRDPRVGEAQRGPCEDHAPQTLARVLCRVRPQRGQPRVHKREQEAEEEGDEMRVAPAYALDGREEVVCVPRGWVDPEDGQRSEDGADRDKELKPVEPHQLAPFFLRPIVHPCILTNHQVGVAVGGLRLVQQLQGQENGERSALLGCRWHWRRAIRPNERGASEDTVRLAGFDERS